MHNSVTLKHKKKFVICDDDLTDIKLFKKQLGSNKLKHIELIELTKGCDLLNLLKENNSDIDLVFLDYYLGAESGIEILREIRTDNLVPVIMLTGRGDEEIAVECMKEGAMDYVPKDALPEIDIMKTVQRACEKWEIERERNQLLGIAAHELRNPIAVISGYTEMLQTYEELESEKRGEIYKIINERANHLLNIINDLLDISRIDKGIIKLKKKDVDLVALVKKKASDYHLLGAKKKIMVEFCSDINKLMAPFDIDRVEEVLSNLIDNAIKYSPRGTCVKVSVYKNAGYAVFSIEDHGLGIREDELKYLFNLFSSKKISTLPTGDEARTGLGLAICKKVIDAHGGEIIVESKVNEGSKFIVSLPLIGS